MTIGRFKSKLITHFLYPFNLLDKKIILLFTWQGKGFKFTISVILKLAVCNIFGLCTTMQFPISFCYSDFCYCIKHNSFLWQESECYFLLSTVESMAYGLNDICHNAFSFVFLFFCLLFLPFIFLCYAVCCPH